MSERALEFVETWVSQKIDAMDVSAAAKSEAHLRAQAKSLADQCIKDAARDGIRKIEIDRAFADLAAFIAGQIGEARDRGADRSGEAHPGRLVEADDPRVIDEEEDEAKKGAKRR
jgi:multidrug efflux pump subunit AcrA (membrane-fusion protein)